MVIASAPIRLKFSPIIYGNVSCDHVGDLSIYDSSSRKVVFPQAIAAPGLIVNLYLFSLIFLRNTNSQELFSLVNANTIFNCLNLVKYDIADSCCFWKQFPRPLFGLKRFSTGQVFMTSLCAKKLLYRNSRFHTSALSYHCQCTFSL